jgi:hypothetical protein
MEDRVAVNNALGRLLRLGLVALVHEQQRKKIVTRSR